MNEPVVEAARKRQRTEENAIHYAEIVVFAAIPTAKVSTAIKECGTLAKHAKAVAAIRDHGVKPIANPSLAHLFFHLFDAAEFHPRGPSRFLRRTARRQVLLDQQIEMSAYLWSRSTSTSRDQKRFRRKLRNFTRSGMLNTSLRPPSKA